MKRARSRHVTSRLGVARAFLLLAVLSPFSASAAAPASQQLQFGDARWRPVRRSHITTLDASHDLGDLGPMWMTELGMYGDETLTFRWKTSAPMVAKGRWEVSDANDVVLAEGQVGAAPSAGNPYLFTLNFASLGLAPPLNVRIQAVKNNGADVGPPSEPVRIHLAEDGPGTCFTDGGLGLPIAEKLEVIRVAHGVPALGGAIVTKSGMEVFDAVGVRRFLPNPASETPVTKYDRWHLGSDTKAMTSALVGILHQTYPFSLSFGTTMADAFPEWAGTMDPTVAQVTLRQLLAHRSGLYLVPPDQSAHLFNGSLSVTAQRRAFTQAVVHAPYLMAPGVLYKYENANYILAGAMLENIFHQSWESLITQYLFQPLGMTSVGFGSPGVNGAPHPWGHFDDNGTFAPTLDDNPASLGPAGTVHASLADWGKFIRLFLNGHEGTLTLDPSTLADLTTPYTSSDPWFAVWPQSYGQGWGIFGTSTDRTLSHDGSNTLWYARAVVYVDKGYALLAVTNAAEIGDVNFGMSAVNDTMTMLESHHSGCPERTGRKGFRLPPGGMGGVIMGTPKRVIRGAP